MASQEKRLNPYEIELPQSIIDSFARFLVPEIQKFYTSEQGQKELEEWKKKYPNQNEVLCKVQRRYAKGCPSLGHPFLSQYRGRMFCPKGISPVSGNKKKSYPFSCAALVKVIWWPNHSYYC